MSEQKVKSMRCSEQDWKMIKQAASEQKLTIGEMCVTAVKEKIRCRNSGDNDLDEMLFDIQRKVQFCVFGTSFLLDAVGPKGGMDSAHQLTLEKYPKKKPNHPLSG